MHLFALSPDIFLEVIEFLDVPTLLNLRLVDKATCHLINLYEASLSAAVAKNYQWVVDFDYPPPDTQINSMKWLVMNKRGP